MMKVEGGTTGDLASPDNPDSKTGRHLVLTCLPPPPFPSLPFSSPLARLSFGPPSRWTEISKPRRPPLFYISQSQSRPHTLTHTFSPFITSYNSSWGPG
jgi:hypothetical protein